MNVVFSGPASMAVINKHLHAKVLSVIAMTLLMSSCAMVGPDFQKPEADVNEAWGDTEASEVR
jgi:hypothetical protein